MITYLDNILKTCVQKAGLLLVGTILLGVLTFLLSPAGASLPPSPAPAADGNLISERNCLKLRVEVLNGKLSSQDLADIVVTYSPQTEITTPAQRSAAIDPVLKLNEGARCGDSNAEAKERESLCFKESVGTICFPLKLVGTAASP